MIKLVTVAELKKLLTDDADQCITDEAIQALKAEVKEAFNDYNTDIKALMNSFGCSYNSSEEAINDYVNKMVITKIFAWIENGN